MEQAGITGPSDRNEHVITKTEGGAMSQKYCTACGTALSDGIKFCEQCGSPVGSDSVEPVPQPVVQAGLAFGIPRVSSPPAGKGTKPGLFLAVIFLAVVIAAGVSFFVLPKLSGTESTQALLPGSVTTAETVIPIVTTPLTGSLVTTSMPMQKPDPFPNVLMLKERYPFGSEKVASEATVYRYWINDTYQWHNDIDNHYYVQKPGTGNKYLFVFLHLENNGDTRVWFPPAGSVIVYHNGATYTEDKSHYKPDKVGNEEATPVEVKEIQYFQKLNGDEYAEDFGFSHGTELAYLYPGRSNAVDGYIVYEVPQSLIPEGTYVGISFNGKDHGVWRLG